MMVLSNDKKIVIPRSKVHVIFTRPVAIPMLLPMATRALRDEGSVTRFAALKGKQLI